MGSSEFIAPSFEYHDWYGSSGKIFITLKDILKSESYIKQCCARKFYSHFQARTDPEGVPIKDILGVRVLLDGSPGSGKTVLCHHYCKRWAEGSLLEAYFLVVYVALRDVDVSSASRIEDLLSYGKDSLRKAVAEELQATSGEGALLILDGWDELQHELQHKQYLVCKILLRKVLPKCSVLITSRPHSSAWLKQSKAVTRHMVITGFSEDQVKECVASEFYENAPEGESFFSLLESRPDLAKLCNIPLNLAILMYMYKANHHTLPNTLTEIYQKFMINALNRHISKSSLSTEVVEFYAINELPDFERELYKALRRLAFGGFSNDELVFSQQCLKKYHSNLPENALGLMTTSKTFTDTGIKSKYQFLHATVQEFLAAEELCSQTPDVQVDFLRQHLHDDRFRLTILFFCGQVQISSEVKNVFRYPAPILGSYFFYQHWYQEPEHQIKTLLLLMEMILESQNKELCLALSMSVHDMSLDFTRYILSKHDYFILAKFLCFGGCKWKKLDLERCRSENDALNQFSEILRNSPKTLQFEKLTLSPLTYDSDSINQLLRQPPFQSLKALKLQLPYIDIQSGLIKQFYKSQEVFWDLSNLNLHHLCNLSSLTIDAVLSDVEYSKLVQLVHKLKSLTSLQLLPEGSVRIQELDWSQDSVNTKAFGRWSTQCEVLQIKGYNRSIRHSGHSEFLNNMNPSCFCNVQKLHLTHCRLNSEQAHQLFTYLQNSSITELDLSRNYFMFQSPEAAKEKSKRFFLFEEQVMFKELKVNHIAAAEALRSFLQMNKTLVILNLSHCGIDGITMNIITNGISLCRTLAQFHVEGNTISGSGVSTLCSALASEHKSRTLLPNQSPMKLALFLQCCGLNNEDATAIAQLLQKTSRIAGLNLSSNDMSISGVSAIMSAVCSNSPVKTIDLSYNKLGGRYTQKLSQAFERALSMPSELEELLIEYTHLKTSAMRGIVLGLVTNTSLTRLNIHADADIDAGILVDLHNVVASNRILKELSVDVNELELSLFAIVDPISNMLQNNNTLTTLKLGQWKYHRSQCQDFSKICQALQRNFTLTSLTLNVDWEGKSDLEKCAYKESDSVNLTRTRENKPYVIIKINGCL